ncbi:hypothetical protein VTK26DRAFT_1797 [Humicola hyalothermophila]
MGKRAAPSAAQGVYIARSGLSVLGGLTKRATSERSYRRSHGNAQPRLGPQPVPVTGEHAPLAVGSLSPWCLRSGPAVFGLALRRRNRLTYCNRAESEVSSWRIAYAPIQKKSTLQRHMPAILIEVPGRDPCDLSHVPFGARPWSCAFGEVVSPSSSAWTKLV